MGRDAAHPLLEAVVQCALDHPTRQLDRHGSFSRFTTLFTKVAAQWGYFAQYAGRSRRFGWGAAFMKDVCVYIGIYTEKT
jgi:hypothetical protein